MSNHKELAMRRDLQRPIGRVMADFAQTMRWGASVEQWRVACRASKKRSRARRRSSRARWWDLAARALVVLLIGVAIVYGLTILAAGFGDFQ